MLIALAFVVFGEDEGPPPTPPVRSADGGAAEADAELDAEPVPQQLKPRYEGSLGKGQAVGALLQGHGLGPRQVAELVTALRELYSFRQARPGAKYVLELDGRREVKRFEWVHGPLDVYEVVREGEALVGRKVEVPVDIKPAEVGAIIKSSLYRSMQMAGESAALVSLIVDVFAWDIDFFKNQHPGDRFKVIVEKIYKDQKFIRCGRILAAACE